MQKQSPTLLKVRQMVRKGGYLVSAFRQHGISGVVNNLRNDTMQREQPDRVTAQPLRLVIEPTVKCNLDCSFCETNEVFADRGKKHLTPAEFEAILDKLPYVQSLNPTLRGEALMAPGFFEMMKIAKERKLRVRLVTNGLLLAKPVFLERLMKCDVAEVVISVDAVGKRYEAVRVGGSFEKLTEAVRSLKAASDEAGGKPALTIAMVGERSRAQDPIEVMSWAAEVGVRDVEIQPVHNWGDNLLEQPLSQEQILDCRQHAVTLGLYLSIYEPSSGDPGQRHCTFPWDTVVVASDGRVTPCCVHGTDPDRKNFGNLLEQPFEEIWNGEEMQQFRRELRSQDEAPEFCRGCPHY